MLWEPIAILATTASLLLLVAFAVVCVHLAVRFGIDD